MATKTNTEINGRQYFRIRRTIDGVQKNFYGSSKTDAEKKYRQYIEDLARKKDGVEGRKDAVTFGGLAQEYVDTILSVSSKYAQGTIVRYTSSYKTYIAESELVDMKIRDVKASTIQRFYNDLDVSQEALRSINKFMSGLYKWIARSGYSENVLTAVEIPKKKSNSRKHDIEIWTDDEIQTILTSITPGHRQYFLVHLLLYTGMRISEALALKYSDIEDDVIHVDLQYYMGEFKAPKYNSKRTVPMHKDLKDAFEIHKAWHRAEMKKNKYKTDYVFTTSTGGMYHTSSIRTALKRFCESNGIQYRNIHTYRATFCTQLCRCGVPLEVASKLMGHKSMEVTAKHYALVRQETQREAIDKLQYTVNQRG